MREMENNPADLGRYQTLMVKGMRRRTADEEAEYVALIEKYKLGDKGVPADEFATV